MASGTVKSEELRGNAPKDETSVKFKIIIRRLPSGFSQDELKIQLDPVDGCTNFWFRKANRLMDPWSFTRAYLIFQDWDKAVEFKNKFNGYVFIDKQGNESAAVVELAVHQDIPKSFEADSVKNDRRVGTLTDRPEYKAFLEEFNNLILRRVTDFDELIREIEEKEKRLEKGMVCETPLVKFLVLQALEKEKKRLERLQKHKPSLFPKADAKNGDKDKRNRRKGKDDKFKKPKEVKEDGKQIDGDGKKKLEKSKRTDNNGPKRADNAQKPDDIPRPPANETTSKKRGSGKKPKEPKNISEFGNAIPKLLTRDSKGTIENKSVSNKDDNDEKPSLDHSNATKKTELPNEISDQSGKASDEKRRRHAQRPERQIYRPPVRNKEKNKKTTDENKAAET